VEQRLKGSGYMDSVELKQETNRCYFWACPQALRVYLDGLIVYAFVR